MASKDKLYAPIVSRTIAFLIDFFVIVFVINLPILIISMIFRDELISAMLSLMNLTITTTYLVYFTHATGQTLGKRLMKIKVIDIHTGNPPLILNALIREIVGKLISSIFMLGFLAAVLDRKGRAWHDRLADTIVVKQS